MNCNKGGINGLILAIVLVLISIQPAMCLEEDENSVDDHLFNLLDESGTSINVFYSSGCGACESTIPEIKKLSEKYPEVTIYYYDILQSGDNRSIMVAFGKKYNYEYPSIPVLYTGDVTILEGRYEIEEYLEPVLKALSSGDMPDAGFETTLKPVDTDKQATYNSTAITTGDQGSQVSMIMVVLAGLADGINPCAISVLALLLIALSAQKSRKRVLTVGISYTAAVFIFYIMAGLGLLSIVRISGISWYFTVFAGILSIIIGMFAYIEVIRENSTVTIGIPESGKPAIGNLIDKASIPAALVLGIMVGLFELPCTGGIYLAVLGLLSSEMTFLEGLPYLLVYNLMFILPLVIIIFLVAYGISPEKVEKWRISNKKLLKAGMGTILIAIGSYILYIYLL